MKALIWLVGLAALAAGISVVAIYNDGYALLVLPPWRVELSLNLLLILALAVFFLVYLLFRWFGALLAMPASVREYRARRARDTVDAALREAMTMLLEGRFSRALRAAEAAYNAGHASLLAALLAQRAAHGMRDRDREAFWRARAREHDKAYSSARLMVEAGIAADNRDFETARDLLDLLTRNGGRHVEAQRLALRVRQGLGNWREVERIVRQLEKHHAMTAEQARPIRQRAYRELLAQIGQRNDGGAGMEQFLKELADVDRLQPRFVLDAVARLNAAGRHNEAAVLIEEALEAGWDSDLAGAYGDCGGDAIAHIAQAERWLHAHPDDANLLLQPLVAYVGANSFGARHRAIWKHRFRCARRARRSWRSRPCSTSSASMSRQIVTIGLLRRSYPNPREIRHESRTALKRGPGTPLNYY